MSGHSKWKTIKHKKAAADAQRSKAFTKLIKEITVSARTHGGDPAHNANLRMLLDKGKQLNMPMDNAMRAIKKGTGELPGVQYEPYSYEGYGPHGVAIVVEVLTDNKNRAVAELRALFTRKGGALAETGAVGWMFQRWGVVTARGTASEEALLEALLDVTVKDISQEDSSWSIVCDAHSLEAVRKIVESMGLVVEEAEVSLLADNMAQLSETQETVVYEFLEALEELDDVQNVYANVE